MKSLNYVLESYFRKLFCIKSTEIVSFLIVRQYLKLLLAVKISS